MVLRKGLRGSSLGLGYLATCQNLHTVDERICLTPCIVDKLAQSFSGMVEREVVGVVSLHDEVLCRDPCCSSSRDPVDVKFSTLWVGHNHIICMILLCIDLSSAVNAESFVIKWLQHVSSSRPGCRS